LDKSGGAMMVVDAVVLDAVGQVVPADLEASEAVLAADSVVHAAVVT
jgi:hypothetical protein